MYHYAGKKSAEMELDEIERYDTTVSFKANLLMAAIPLLSVIIILLFRSNMYVGAYSGFTYFLYTPAMFWYYNRASKGRKKIIERLS